MYENNPTHSRSDSVQLQMEHAQQFAAQTRPFPEEV